MSAPSPARPPAPAAIVPAPAAPDCLAAALACAGLGWPVVPLCRPRPGGGCADHGPKCGKPGKAPIVRDWPTLADRPAGETTIRGWWRAWPTANLGIVCGGRLRLA